MVELVFSKNEQVFSLHGTPLNQAPLSRHDTHQGGTGEGGNHCGAYHDAVDAGTGTLMSRTAHPSPPILLTYPMYTLRTAVEANHE